MVKMTKVANFEEKYLKNYYKSDHEKKFKMSLKWRLQLSQRHQGSQFGGYTPAQIIPEQKCCRFHFIGNKLSLASDKHQIGFRI